MIKLTEYFTGDEIWINPLLVKAFRLNAKEDGTNIIFIDDTADECLSVKELPEEVNKLFNL